MHLHHEGPYPRCGSNELPPNIAQRRLSDLVAGWGDDPYGADLELAVRLHATDGDALADLPVQRRHVGSPDEIHCG